MPTASHKHVPFMPPSTAGPIWLHFERIACLPYSKTSAYVFARCKLCTPEVTHTKFTKLEKLLNGSEEERKAGREEARMSGLVMGRDKEMNSHLRKCGSASADVKLVALEHVNGKTKKGSTAPATTPLGSTAAASGPSSSSVVVGARSSKRKRTQSSVDEYGAFGNRFRHDVDQHSSLIAEFLSVTKVLFNAVASPEFHRLQDFYLITAD